MHRSASQLQNTILLAEIDGESEALIAYLVSVLRMSTRRFTAYGDGLDDLDLLGMVVRENADDDPVSLRIRRRNGEQPGLEVYLFWAGAHPSEQTVQECQAEVDDALAGFTAV